MRLGVKTVACATFVLFSCTHVHAAISETEQKCTVDAAGNKVCTPPPPPPTDLDTVVVTGSRISEVDPRWWLEAYNRYVYDSLFGRQTGPSEPNPPQGAGSPGAPTEADNNKVPCDTATGAPVTTAGNPIDYSNGNKVEYEYDFASAGEVPLYLQRGYNRYWSRKGLFGYNWVSNFDLAIANPDGQTITAYRDNATMETYVYQTSPSAGWYALGSTARIVGDGAGGYIRYGADNSVERYNAAGQITSQKNSRGIGLTFTYAGGLLDRVTHTSGRFVQFSWSGGNLTSVRDPAGNIYQYGYIAKITPTAYFLASATLPGTPAATINYHYENTWDTALTGKSFNGVRYSTFTYDAYGRANSTMHSGGVDKHTFVYAFPSAGRMTVEHTNPLGKKSNYTFDNGRLTAETGQPSTYCPNATARSLTYDPNGYRDRVTDFNGGVTDYDFSQTGRLEKRVEASGTAIARETRYAWDGNNRNVQTVVVGHSQVDRVYRADGLISSITVKNLSNGVVGQQRATTYAYTFHPNGMLNAVVEDGPIAGATDATTTTFDVLGNLTAVTNGLGHATTYSNFNGLGLPGRTVSVNGAITDYTYDARGKILTTTTYLNSTPYTTTNTYDNRGRLTKAVSPEGVATSFAYDTNNRLTKVTQPSTQSAYASLGTNLIDYQATSYNLNGDATQVETGVIYTPAGSGAGVMASQAVLPGEVMPMACHPQPDCEGDPDPDPEPTVSELVTYRMFIDYDELGRVRAKRGNGGQNVRYAYDDNGNIKTITDSLNRVTTLTFDALNRVSTSLDAKNGTTEFRYDAGDQVVWVKDPRGLITNYTYDGFGQLWSQTSPDTGTTAFQRNAAGQLTLMTRNDGSWLSYGYDDLGRLTWYGNSGTNGRGYSYDSCTNGKGKLCSFSSAPDDAWTSFHYTPQGQLATRDDNTYGVNSTTSYAYDGMGRLTGVGYPSGVYVGYGYTSGKLSGVYASIGGTNVNVATNLQYQPFGPVANWTYGSGLSRRYNYDLDGRLTGISAGDASTVKQSLTYGFNANDEITAITNGVNANLTQQYGYDELLRLTNVTASSANETITYDASGNRTLYSWLAPIANSVDPNSNRINNDYISNPGSGIVYGHDTRGNRQSQSWGGSTATYAYDAFNRLESVTRTAASTYQNPGYVTMTYPAGTTSYAMNALDQRAGKTGVNGTSRFVYGGQTQLLAEHTNGVWSSYLWLGGELIGLVRNSQLYYTHGDHLGRPEIVTNNAKAVVWSAKNYHSERGVTQDNIGGLNMGFPGQYFDAESGLWHNGYRDYDSRLGRYIQSDPIGLAGGVNTYAYVNANPVNLVDSLGLSERDVAVIRQSFTSISSSMTQGGLRNTSPFINNLQRSLGRATNDLVGDSKKMDCGEQTDYMNDALSSGTYDDNWSFTMDAGIGHAWGVAQSSNPNDPMLWYDTRSGEFSVGSPCATCSGWFGDSTRFP